jgi:hypothetical protein
VVRETSNKSVLLGVLDRWFPPDGNKAGKFYMTTDDNEQVHLTIWPVYETPQPWDEDTPLKPYMRGLDPYDMVDRTVQVIADYKGERNGVDQYTPTQIKVSGRKAQESAPSPGAKAAPRPARNTSAEDAPIRPSRAELGAAKGNAITNATSLIVAHVQKTGKLPDRGFLEDGVGLIHYTTQLILAERDAQPSNEQAPEQTGPGKDGEIIWEDDASLGVLSVEDDNGN